MKVFIAYSWQEHDLAQVLKQVLLSRGEEVIDPFGSMVEGDLLTNVLTHIRSADVIAGILTAQRINVILELGMAVGAGMPVIIAANAGVQIPSDLAAIPYVELTGDLHVDAQEIARRLSMIRLVERKAIKKYTSAEDALRIVLEDPDYLDAMDSEEFERLVAGLFKERGYSVTLVDSAQEAGYDFIIRSLRNEEHKIMVQVKKNKRQSLVSVETVRKLLNVIPFVGASSVMCISTSDFTAAAITLGSTSSVILRTLNEVLKAKSEKELLKKGLD